MPAFARQGMSDATDPAVAVAQIAEQVGGPDLDAVFLFCSSRYDLAVVGPALRSAFSCPVVACTSSGQLGPRGFQSGGMGALGLGGGGLEVVPHLIHPLKDYEDQVIQIAATFRDFTLGPGNANPFAFLVIDGLSRMEERVVSALYRALDNVPLVGGSAADDGAFLRTQVYFDGQFLSDAAVLAACRTRGAVAPFMLSHYVPGPEYLVITDADCDRRIIREFNGEPAAQAYADAVRVPLAALDDRTFSNRPLLLQVGGEQCVRAIARVNPDLSLSLFCAIEPGLAVAIGRIADPLAALEGALAYVSEAVPNPVAILACDCILRRTQFQHLGLDREVGACLARNGVFGFSTYGEQINGLHLNQTLTGLVIGRAEPA